MRFQPIFENFWKLWRFYASVRNFWIDMLLDFANKFSKNFPFHLQGGESTTDEMCLNFIMYYPNVNISFCATARTKVDHFSKKYKKRVTNKE